MIYANVGNDTATGGLGDDTFYVSSSSLPTAADGGGDSTIGDTLILQNLAGTYSLAPLAAVTNNMEILSIRGDSASTTLTVTTADVRNFVDGGNGSSLTIKADTGDLLSLTIDAAGRQSVELATVANDTTYTIFDSAHTQIAQIHWQTA